MKRNAVVFFNFYLLFLGGHFLWSIFRAGLWKFGQKSFAPRKRCLFLRLCSNWLALVSAYCLGECYFLPSHPLACGNNFSCEIHCSVYITNFLLPANSMCSWAPYLFECKPRLTKIFRHFMRLTTKGGLHFLFFYFIERYRWRSVSSWERFVDQILISHSIFFSITCKSVTEGIMMNRRQL